MARLRKLLLPAFIWLFFTAFVGLSLPAQFTHNEQHADSTFLVTRPLRNHIKIYLSDIVGLALRNGRVELGREFVVNKSITAEVDLGLRNLPQAVALDAPFFFGWPTLRRTNWGPYGGINFRWYPNVRVISDRSRNFAGICSGLAADISQVSFKKLDIYSFSWDRLVNTQTAYDADVYSFRVTPFIGYSEFFRGNTAPGRGHRGITAHANLGWTFDWEKIVGDIEDVNSNRIKPGQIRKFYTYPSFRMGVGFAF